MEAAPFDPEYWRCQYQHGRLRAIDGSPEKLLLVRESHQFLHDNEAFLMGMQLIQTLNTTSARDAIPTWKFYASRNSPQIYLQAFVELVRHSKKLDAWPDVKTAFWLTVSGMQQPYGSTPQMTEQLIPDPRFPRFMVCIGNRPKYGGAGVDVLLNEALCDAVYDTLTTPATGTEAQPEAEAKPVVELSFGHYETSFRPDRTREQLELIESLLDRLLQSPTLQFKVTTLDFNNSVMIGPLLEVAARIMAKCSSGFYQIEQIQMDGIINWNGSRDQTPREFRGLVASAFSVDSLPRFWSFQPPSITQAEDAGAPSVLQKVSLSRNRLVPNFLPEHFSTLRYGCPLVEDRTEYAIDFWSRFKEELGVDCWRWLAFGLFYPRPKRFAQAYKLRTIGKLTVDSLAIRAIVNTLQNPVAQLVYNDLEGADTPAPDCLMVCTVKEGASIEVFVSGTTEQSANAEASRWQTRPIDPWYKILLKTSELEALCERDDGSVCVVVPGAGLGWVSKDDVILLEREPLDLAWPTLDGMYGMTISTEKVGTDVSELRSLFHTIGPQIKSLTLEFDPPPPGLSPMAPPSYPHDSVIHYIRDYCINLKHLRFDAMAELGISALSVALESTSSSLRARLLTLDLNNRSIDDAGLVRLADVLADTKETPLALQELRVNYSSTAAAPIASLHQVLSTNRTLKLLELSYLEQETFPHYRERMNEQARLDAAFQGQFLRSYSPMDVKLAFLSVVNDQFATTQGQGRAHHLALSEILLSRILSFAPSIETRRMIAWNPCGIHRSVER